MHQNTYIKTSLHFFLTIVFALSIQSGYSKSSFPVQETKPSSFQHSTNLKTKKATFKPFKKWSKNIRKYREKEDLKNLFGLLAIFALICSFVSLISFGLTLSGGIITTLFFVSSCLFAYYGTSKDPSRRLARLTLIIDLVILLSMLFSFWIVTLLSL